jgi:hypothetical protein
MCSNSEYEVISLADGATRFVYIPRESYPATRLQPAPPIVVQSLAHAPQVNQVDHVIVRGTCRSYRYTYVILDQWVPKQKVILIYKEIQGIIVFRSSSASMWTNRFRTWSCKASQGTQKCRKYTPHVWCS